MLWSTRTGELIARLDGPPVYARDLTFSPDGRMLAPSAHNNTIEIWDLRSRRLIQTLQLPSVPFSLKFSIDS